MSTLKVSTISPLGTDATKTITIGDITNGDVAAGAFANTPAQYARLIKKAALDLKNRRGDVKTNISKIIS